VLGRVTIQFFRFFQKVSPGDSYPEAPVEFPEPTIIIKEELEMVDPQKLELRVLATEDRLVHPEKSKEITCGICLGVLEDPMQCSNGHLFCAECIRVSIAQKEQCPQCRCRVTFDSLSRSLFVRQYISNLLIHCQYHYTATLDPDQTPQPDPEGCAAQVKLCDLEQHERVCEYSFTRCPFTYSNSHKDFHLVRKCKLETHQKECVLRPAICRYCEICIPFNTLLKHEQNCPRMPIVCDKCKLETFKGEIVTHIENDCEYQTIPCPFSAHGCPITVLRKDVNDHVAKNYVQHLLYLQKSHDHQLAQQRQKFERALEINHKEINHLRKQLQSKNNDTKFSVQWTIPGFLSKKMKYLQSDPFSFYGFNWFIGLYPFGDNRESGNYLSIYMFVDSKTLPKSKSITLDFTIKVVNQLTPSSSVVKQFHMTFPIQGQGQGWGDRKAISRDQITAESGFMLNNAVVLELDIQVLNVSWVL